MKTKEGVFYEYNHDYYKGFLKEDEEDLLEVNSSSGYKNVTLVTDIPVDLIELRLRELYMEHEAKAEEEMASIFFTDNQEKIADLKKNLTINNSGFKTIAYKNLLEKNTIFS